MIKRLLLTLLVLVNIIAAAPVVYADEVLTPGCEGVSDSALCKDNSKAQTPDDNSLFGPQGILTKVASLISILVGVAAVIFIIVGGFQYVIASGDPTNIQNAKNTVLYAIIGLIVALLARAIIAFVLVRIN